MWQGISPAGLRIVTAANPSSNQILCDRSPQHFSEQKLLNFWGWQITLVIKGNLHKKRFLWRFPLDCVKILRLQQHSLKFQIYWPLIFANFLKLFTFFFKCTVSACRLVKASKHFRFFEIWYPGEWNVLVHPICLSHNNSTMVYRS